MENAIIEPTMTEILPLKLFVLGEISGNPDEWQEYCGHAIVIARTKEEALSLHDGYGYACEISLDRPMLICETTGATHCH